MVDDVSTDDLTIRPPLQERSRLAWERVLDAGARLIEDEGYEGFTIAAVCARADVSVATIYARASSKDALFLAVYEHVLADIADEELVFEDVERWDAMTTGELVREAVSAVADRFLLHARFLGSIILLSGTHVELRRRGAEYTQRLGGRFAAVILRRAAEIRREDPALAVDACFRMVFSTLAIHVSYGGGFESTRATDDAALVHEVRELAASYLLSPVA
jgi:AcrR family transcriptional regulator